MAIPTKAQLMERVALSPAAMDPKEYPLGYAELLIVQHPTVLPATLHQVVSERMRNPFTETYAPVVLEWWANSEGENIYTLATALADVYLELSSIVPLENIPEMTSRKEWMNWMSSIGY